MELSDKQALLLCVQALPTADVWHEISQKEMISISQQAARELARLESVELEAAQQADSTITCGECGKKYGKDHDDLCLMSETPLTFKGV